MTLGAGGYIEGFEEGIVGMKTGETKELNLTFPIPYNNNPSLAGADVVFTITMNHIYEEVTPEFDDEFVAGLEIEGVTTAEEYRQYAYDNLMSIAEAQRDTEVETAVLQAVSENAAFKAVPEAMVERYYDRLVSNLTYQASMYGLDLETFLLYGTGLTQEEYEAEMQASAEEAVKQILVLQAIAEKEGMTVTEEDIEADLEENAANYGYESAEEYKEALGSELQGYGEYLMTERMTAYLVENAVVTDAEPETEETETAETEAAETETAETEAAETEGTAETAETSLRRSCGRDGRIRRSGNADRINGRHAAGSGENDNGADEYQAVIQRQRTVYRTESDRGGLGEKQPRFQKFRVSGRQ